MQGHEVTEDARQGDHHIDTGATEFDQWNQAGAGNAAIAVKPGQRTHEGQCLGDGSPFVFQVVTAPQHHGNGFGQRVAVSAVALNQQFGLSLAITHSHGAGDSEGVKAVDIATGGQHCRRAQYVATGCRANVASVQGSQQSRHLGIHRQQSLGLDQLTQHAQ